MKFLLSIFLCLTAIQLHAEEATEASEPALETVLVKPEITTQSIFPDRVASAAVHFDGIVEQPFFDLIENDSCRIINVQTYETADTEGTKSAAIIQFQVRKPGIATLPSMQFEAEGKVYETQPIQFRASQAQRSDELKLSITPAKTTVYLGEPVRFDLTWETTLQASALQNLKLNPSFFENTDIEVAVPRNTANENQQVGLPVGGRRVIAHRERYSRDSKSLGKVTLPLYLRFTKAGTFTLPATRLEISKLAKPKSSFGQYAAHFNNSFFVPTEDEQVYERLFTESEALTIEVLPLPTTAEAQNFSGIFAPAELTASIKPSDTVQIGQLLELELKLRSDTPTSLLKLPPLNQQASFDERFLVNGDFGKTWEPGATNFKQRIRILSTTIQSIPPIQFTTFNPDSGKYETLSTPELPLTVHPYKDQQTIPLKTLNATKPLNSNPEGIWYNYPKQTMNDLLQQLLHFINQYFWLLLALIPALAALSLPLIKEAHKKANNASYRLQKEALHAFQKAPNNTKEKWDTLLAWLASHFQAKQQAWTYSDTHKALEEIHANKEDLAQMHSIHQQLDQAMYDPQATAPNFSSLTSIAKRLQKLLPLLILTLCLSLQSLEASTHWESAESNFQQAQQNNDAQVYAQSALEFEAAAKANQRPTSAWYNAGNAWFQAGELGRSIAAYRQAKALAPWDSNIQQNLTAARTLVANDVTLQQNKWEELPLVTLKTSTLLLALVCVGLLLAFYRFRTRRLLKPTITCAVLLLISLGATTVKSLQQQPAGVISSNQVIGKKGPSYAYANAFDTTLKDGLEFTLLESRENWHRIQLQDKRQCWIPSSQATLIE